MDRMLLVKDSTGPGYQILAVESKYCEVVYTFEDSRGYSPSELITRARREVNETPQRRMLRFCEPARKV